MSWTARLSQPIALDTGQVLLTLRDARKFILALPEEDRGYAKWERLARLLLIAAETDRADTIAIATERLRQALQTSPFASVGLADEPTKKPPAPSIKRRGRAKLQKLS